MDYKISDLLNKLDEDYGIRRWELVEFAGVSLFDTMSIRNSTVKDAAKTECGRRLLQISHILLKAGHLYKKEAILFALELPMYLKVDDKGTSIIDIIKDGSENNVDYLYSKFVENVRQYKAHTSISPEEVEKLRKLLESL